MRRVANKREEDKEGASECIDRRVREREENAASRADRIGKNKLKFGAVLTDIDCIIVVLL